MAAQNMRQSETQRREHMRDTMRAFKEHLRSDNQKAAFEDLDVLATDTPGYHDVAIAESLKPFVKSGDAKVLEAFFDRMDSYGVNVDGIPWTQRLLHVNRHVLLWALAAGQASIVDLLLARGSSVDEGHIRAAAIGERINALTMRKLLRAHNEGEVGCTATIVFGLMGNDAASHRSECLRMQRLVAILRGAARTADGREARFRGIPQLVRDLKPFERRAHLNVHGTDIRDEVWAAVVPNTGALPDTLRAVQAITHLGIDLTENAAHGSE